MRSSTSPTARMISFVSQNSIDAFKAALDKAKVDYKFENFPDTVHSFTVPGADKHMIKGMKYNKAADEKSWKEMQVALQGDTRQVSL